MGMAIDPAGRFGIGEAAAGPISMDRDLCLADSRCKRGLRVGRVLQPIDQGLLKGVHED